MAAITPTQFKILHAYDGGQVETLMSAADTANTRQGKVAYIAPTTGLAVLADASTVAEITGNSGINRAIIGFITTPSRSSLAGESCTLLMEGLVDLGDDVVESLNDGAPVFLSNTAGLIDDAAGTVSVQLGYVVSIRNRHDGEVRKFLRVSTGHLTRVGAVVAS